MSLRLNRLAPSTLVHLPFHFRADCALLRA